MPQEGKNAFTAVKDLTQETLLKIWYWTQQDKQTCVKDVWQMCTGYRSK